jgi:hypothetical protein
MTPERFETLAEAWGGDVARWPVGEREAAAVLMAARSEWAQAVLARAGDLDAALAAYAPPQASARLAETIAAGAPAPRRRWRAWLLPAGMGAGLAAACAAGMVLGVQLGAPNSVLDTGEAFATAVSDDALSLYLDEEVG